MILTKNKNDDNADFALFKLYQNKTTVIKEQYMYVKQAKEINNLETIFNTGLEWIQMSKSDPETVLDNDRWI